MKKIVSMYEDRDDAVHPFDSPDYYEWWYLDASFDNGYSCALSCFWRTRYEDIHVPMIIVDIYPPEGERIRGAQGFDYKDCHASPEKCDVTWQDNYLRQEGDRYNLHLKAGDVAVRLTYRRKVPGWKWTPDGLLKNDASGKQGWTNAVPRAEVTGDLVINGKSMAVKGEGYHDHNWGDVEMSHSFAGWGWGRMFDPLYTFIYGWFMPERDGDPVIPSLYVARGSETVFATPAKWRTGSEISRWSREEIQKATAMEAARTRAVMIPYCFSRFVRASRLDARQTVPMGWPSCTMGRNRYR